MTGDLLPHQVRKQIRIAVVGLEFGAAFAPIYADHPHVEEVVLCDRDQDLANRAAARTGPARTAHDLDQILADKSIDAVHLVTGLRDHADHTIRALEAGKHVACAVPMALSFGEIEAIQEARRRSGTVYMMMETALYTREFRYAQRLMRDGWFGDISFGRGTHFQDMTGWPSYWAGLPPMYYMTHAVAPLLALLGTTAKSVRALGAGRYAPDTEEPYGRTFPVECALFDLVDHPAVLDITRSLGLAARPYTESFSVYGSRASFEWPQLEQEAGPLVYEMDPAAQGRGRDVTVRRPRIEDTPGGLPPSIAGYTEGHGGSHPYLVHEFVSAITEGRTSAIDQVRAAQFTAPGIAAHESALRGGVPVDIPSFEE
ncbi:Gfo/Idh/MocA family oxidoreductase [Streptomyces sp. CA-251251]|uniref:Gfo/Idh/MocA family oxidoreductase n=1 Tax=Streptomyces sp. CA-251251 TaxID=3240063 RepID=UPI003D91965B